MQEPGEFLIASESCMGWLHNFNLKRKVIGILTSHRGQPQTAAAIAGAANAEESEVEQLLAVMQQAGYLVSERQRGVNVYRLNEAQETVGKVLQMFEDEEHDGDSGLTLRRESHGWTAELSNPAGLIVRGSSREEARERGLAMMKRMAALPGDAPQSESALEQR